VQSFPIIHFFVYKKSPLLTGLRLFINYQAFC